MHTSSSGNISEYDKYLASLHSNLVTPDEFIRDVVKEGSGSEMLEKHRIIAGEVSEVYKIILVNHKELILRISRSGYPNFQQEIWAIKQVKQVGVSAPTILLVKYLPINGKEYSFCLMEKLEGGPLERGDIKFWEYTAEEQAAYIRQAGELLSRIHSIKTNGFGWIIGEGKPQYENSEDLINEWLNKVERFQKIMESQNFAKTKIDRAIKIVSELKEVYKNVVPSLNHADFGHKHFMVIGDKIVGIIDWGSVRSDSAVYDFACWDYWFGHYIPTKWLQEGYVNKDVFDDSFEDILHRIRIMKGLEVLDWYDREHYIQMVKDALEKLQKDIQYFS